MNKVIRSIVFLLTLAVSVATSATALKVTIGPFETDVKDYPVVLRLANYDFTFEERAQLGVYTNGRKGKEIPSQLDDNLNGGQSQRLYLDAFNFDSYLMQDVIVDPEHPNDRNYSEVYSNYGGCSVFFEGEGVPTTVTPIVYGHSSTYTKDCDGDGQNDLKYPYENGTRFLAMASEQLAGKGLIIVSGAAFMSNFEVQAAASDGSSDSETQKNYSNYKICENLVKGFNEVEITPIATVQAQTEEGLIFTIEGVVTSNASGFDKDTAFFDCIYVQDDTAGICCFQRLLRRGHAEELRQLQDLREPGEGLQRDHRDAHCRGPEADRDRPGLHHRGHRDLQRLRL